MRQYITRLYNIAPDLNALDMLVGVQILPGEQITAPRLKGVDEKFQTFRR